MASASSWRRSWLRARLEAKANPGQASTGGAPYWTDGGWFAQVGIASLICGPGEYAQAHQPNESIPHTALERGPAMILQVIDRLCC